MEQVMSFKERQRILFEEVNKYKILGYKIVSQKNFSTRLKKLPFNSEKMNFKKKMALIKSFLFKRNRKLGKRKEFVDIGIDMYGNICVKETS